MRVGEGDGVIGVGIGLGLGVVFGGLALVGTED